MKIRMPKKRYIAVIVIGAISGAATIFSIDLAYRFRGYYAIGGEYAILILGLLMATIILETADDFKKWLRKGKQKHDKNKRNSEEEKEETNAIRQVSEEEKH